MLRRPLLWSSAITSSTGLQSNGAHGSCRLISQNMDHTLNSSHSTCPPALPFLTCQSREMAGRNLKKAVVKEFQCFLCLRHTESRSLDTTCIWSCRMEGMEWKPRRNPGRDGSCSEFGEETVRKDAAIEFIRDDKSISRSGRRGREEEGQREGLVRRPRHEEQRSGWG